MCFTSARRSRRLRTGRSSEAGVFFAWWISVDVCMPLWSWTDGRGQTSAACVCALHMLKLGEVAGADAERRTLGQWSARRVVGLVGFGGLWTANRAPRNWLSGRRGEGGRSGLGAQTDASGGTSGPNWGHNRRAAGGFGGIVSGQTSAAKFLRGGGLAAQAWGHKPARLGAYPCRTGGTTGRRVVGSVGVRKLFWPVARGKPPCGRPLRWGIPP